MDFGQFIRNKFLNFQINLFYLKAENAIPNDYDTIIILYLLQNHLVFNILNLFNFQIPLFID